MLLFSVVLSQSIGTYAAGRILSVAPPIIQQGCFAVQQTRDLKTSCPHELRFVFTVAAGHSNQHINQLRWLVHCSPLSPCWKLSLCMVE